MVEDCGTTVNESVFSVAFPDPEFDFGLRQKFARIWKSSMLIKDQSRLIECMSDYCRAEAQRLGYTLGVWMEGRRLRVPHVVLVLVFNQLSIFVLLIEW